MDEGPRVTVTDPNRDVVVSGDEREPFRASRKQKGAVAAAVVLALLVAGVVQVVRHQREQDRLDAASLKQVALAVITPVDDAETTPGSVRLAVRNDTGSRVHVETLSIDLPGLSEVRVDLDAALAEIVPIEVPDGLTCSPAVADLSRSVTASLRVRTERGVRGTFATTLLSDAVNTLLSRAQERCHYFPPDRALSVTSGDHRTVGRTVVTTLGLANAGLLPLTATGISGPPGFSVRTDRRFPLDLAPAEFDAQGTPTFADVSLTVTFGISDCGAAGQAVTSTEVDPTFVLGAQGPNGTTGETGFQPGFDKAPLAALYGELCT